MGSLLMASIKNFFSRLFLSTGDAAAAPVNQKIAASPNKKASLFKRMSTMFRNQNNANQSENQITDQDQRKPERHHSEMMAATTETLSGTRMSLDGTCLNPRHAQRTPTALLTKRVHSPTGSLVANQFI